jgi:hypothetical protein
MERQISTTKNGTNWDAHRVHVQQSDVLRTPIALSLHCNKQQQQAHRPSDRALVVPEELRTAPHINRAYHVPTGGKPVMGALYVVTGGACTARLCRSVMGRGSINADIMRGCTKVWNFQHALNEHLKHKLWNDICTARESAFGERDSLA